MGVFKSVTSIQDMRVLGHNVVGSATGELRPGSTSPYQKSLLESLPLGMIQWGKLTTDGPNTTSTQKGFIEIAAPIYHNRMYKLCSNALRVRSSDTSSAAHINCFYTTGTAGDSTNWPSTPLVASSTNLGRSPITTIDNASGHFMFFQYLWRPDPGSVTDHAFAYNARFLLSLERAAGSGTLFVDGTTEDVIEFWIEDIGPARANGGQANPGDGSVTAVPLRTTTKTYTSNGYRTYKGDGTERTGTDVTGPRQGYSSANGDQKGLWTFPTISSDLTGATITRVRAYITSENWSGNSGTAKFGVHNYTLANAPASSPTLVANSDHTNWGEGVGKWVDLPNVSGLYAGLIAGTVKGISVGPAGTEDRLYTGKFAASAQIEIQFTK